MFQITVESNCAGGGQMDSEANSIFSFIYPDRFHHEWFSLRCCCFMASLPTSECIIGFMIMINYVTAKWKETHKATVLGQLAGYNASLEPIITHFLIAFRQIISKASKSIKSSF